MPVGISAQLEPPSVVLSIVPLYPVTYPVDASKNLILFRFWVVPEFSAVHTEPPLVVLSSAPTPEQVNPVLASTK